VWETVDYEGQTYEVKDANNCFLVRIEGDRNGDYPHYTVPKDRNGEMDLKNAHTSIGRKEHYGWNELEGPILNYMLKAVISHHF
jgi:hypothetical protein